MKYLKIIGLAALAAMALMAVVAASASANAKVCSTTGTGAECGAGHGKVYKGAIVAKNVGNVILKVTNSSGSTINTVTCTSSEAGGEITNGETGTGNINKLTFSSCTSNICGAVHATSNAATAKWAATATTEKAGTVNTNGLMHVTNPTGTFSCTFLGINVSCHYTAATATVGVDGGHDPLITAQGVTLTGSGSNASVCGTSAHWTGTYTVSTPASLFVI
jgi:hypothetical protein